MREPKYRNERWLREKYLDEGLSLREIATMGSCGRTAVGCWLRRFNIPIRSTANHVRYTTHLKEFMSGLLLGDGHLNQANPLSARYQHADKHKEYIEWLSSELRKHGIQQSGQIGVMKKHRRNPIARYYVYNSKSYRELPILKQRFYRRGRKTIPKNLKITPVIVMNYYVGDGSWVKKQRYCQIRVHSFTNKELSLISSQLEKAEILNSVTSNGIYIRVRSCSNFFNYILSSGLRPPCYAYKFPEEYRGEFP